MKLWRSWAHLSTRSWHFFFLTDFIEVPQLLAGRFQFLCLKTCLYYIKWIRHKSSQTSSEASTEEVPNVWVLLVPRLKVSFEVLIHTDYSGCEWYVHHDCHRVRAVQSMNALFFDDVLHALSRCQVWAQLKSLLYHYFMMFSCTFQTYYRLVWWRNRERTWSRPQ
jgi:hypothetical protein